MVLHHQGRCLNGKMWCWWESLTSLVMWKETWKPHKIIHFHANSKQQGMRAKLYYYMYSSFCKSIGPLWRFSPLKWLIYQKQAKFCWGSFTHPQVQPTLKKTRRNLWNIFNSKWQISRSGSVSIQISTWRQLRYNHNRPRYLLYAQSFLIY